MSSNIDKTKIKNQDYYQELMNEVRYHNDRYYIFDSPIISDQEYDSLYKKLEVREQNHPDLVDPMSPTQHIEQGIIQSSLQKRTHTAPLLSLKNTYDAKEVRDWHDSLMKLGEKEGVKSRSYTIEPKYDGLSIELIYEYGQLQYAITRGDGNVGEDITKNVYTIHSLPKYIRNRSKNKCIALRGEIIMPKNAFKKLNEERVQSNSEVFANERNAASGTVRQLDSTITAKRKLECIVYDIIYRDQISGIKAPQNHINLLNILQKNGIPAAKLLTVCHSIEEVVSLTEDKKLQDSLYESSFALDGLVIKINEKEVHELFGSTAHHPRGSIAYKYAATQARTKLLDVHFFVGRSGVLTPVGTIQPITLSGATISHVTLHNMQQIYDKDLHINDMIWLQRSGEVIPYVVGIIKKARPKRIITANQYKYESMNGRLYKKNIDSSVDVENTDSAVLIEIKEPVICPSCSHATEKISSYWYCVNPQCPQQLHQRLSHAVSKDALQIEGLGPKIINLLIQHNFLSSIADIFDLPKNQKAIMELPRMGEKRVNDLCKEINEAKQVSLRRLLHSLGIPGIGKQNAQHLELFVQKQFSFDIACPTYAQIIDILSDKETVSQLHGFGTELVSNLTTYFCRPETHHLCKRLFDRGVSFANFSSHSVRVSGILSGSTIVITGAFDTSRKELQEILQNKGATIQNSIRNDTHYLLTGNNPGSKVKKAQEKGIPIVHSLEELYKLHKK